MEPLHQTITYRVDERVAVISFNRPDRMNALLPGMGAQFADLLRRADDDPDVRAIVVTGVGRGFCSGADLSVLAEGADALDGYGAGQDVDTLPTLAWRIGTPVVTAINGPCAGIGVIHALCADRRIAARTATIGAVFSRLGLIAEYGAAWIITRLAGLAAAQDLLISGRTVDAEEAWRLGLVDEVVDDALARAMEWAHDVARNCSPTAVAVIKRQIAEVDSQSLPEAVDLALAEMQASFRRPDFGLAITARMAKQRPVFPPRETS